MARCSQVGMQTPQPRQVSPLTAAKRFGFEPSDESRLRKLGSSSVYKFLDYARERDIVTVLAHPLYYYTRRKGPMPLEAWEKLALLFERFEVLNGQRDSWQNLLAVEWLEAMTPDRIDEIARREGIEPDRFCADPYSKRFCGGSGRPGRIARHQLHRDRPTVDLDEEAP